MFEDILGDGKDKKKKEIENAPIVHNNSYKFTETSGGGNYYTTTVSGSYVGDNITLPILEYFGPVTIMDEIIIDDDVPIIYYD